MSVYNTLKIVSSVQNNICCMNTRSNNMKQN
jgi:hypothetical protein